ncbi:MAG TPA: TVP38/TMEM64 family protein [Oscillatoriaceae cyanobacterium M7585_C2015_266]|nr:TVP38/TMEM64 family protein [Oscillatoriaceae cyanobacterium M7585_C2015_266]
MKNNLRQVKASAAIFFIFDLLVAAHFFNIQALLQQGLSWIEHLGAFGVVVFIVLYILATVFFLPGSVLTLGAGALFGVVWGFIFVSFASTLGATCAFLIGRYLTRNWVEKQLESNQKFKAIDEAVAREGWKIVGLTRLSPIFPFNFLNYAFGVTRVSLRDYFFASWIGMMPGTLMYVYIGSLAKDVTAIGMQVESHTWQWILRLIGLFATVLVTLFVTRLAKEALENQVSF